MADQLGYHSRQAAWKAVTSLLNARSATRRMSGEPFMPPAWSVCFPSIWNAAINGDISASQQALKVLFEIGKVCGVAAPIKVGSSSLGSSSGRH